MEDQDKTFDDLRKHSRRVERSVMRQNIYRDFVFEKIVRLDKAIWAIADQTGQMANDVIEAAGIMSPVKLLDEAMNHWDARLNASNLPSEDELVQRLRTDFKVRVGQAAEVYVPTDEPAAGGEGVAKRQEAGEDANRVALALETLLHMKIGDCDIRINDLEIIAGRVPENTWRTRPYWIIALKKYRISILVNNQFGNRTFVFAYKKKGDLEDLAHSTKEDLKKAAYEGALIYNFIYHDPCQFKADLAAAVLKVAGQVEMNRPYATYEEAKAAVHHLGIQTQHEYRKRYKKDPRLPSAPDKKYGKAFIGWSDFLRNEEVTEFYETYEDAKAAVQRLGVQTFDEYKKRYREDPRLPSHPEMKYGNAFIGWFDFLRNEKAPEFYATYEEAKAAVQRLGIKTLDVYKKRYKKDPGLPRNPDRKYGEAFIGWPDFLRNEKPPEFYETYQEAKAAVQRLGIKTFDEYNTRYKEDPGLPSAPDKKYGEAFIGWSDFLRNEKPPEFHETYQEAKTAVQRLGIKTKNEYITRYKEDSKLPSNPNKKYGEAWLGWRDFLGKANKM